MAQTPFLNLTKLLRLQAADFLAIAEHVKDTCITLAAILFSEEPKNHNKRTEDDPTQVLFSKHATRFVRWQVISLQGRTTSLCLQHALIKLPRAVLFVLSATFFLAHKRYRLRLS
jgi:hypothetical protein